MKAAVLYEANEPLRVEELEQQSPQTGEVRVRMEAAGVCASDHHVMHGSALLPTPVVLGHEGAGVVEEIGPGVTAVAPGDRCILSFVSNCGHCRMCRSGSPQLCDTNAQTGTLQFDGTSRLRNGEGTEVFQMAKLGVFSESIVCPEQACLSVPDNVPMEVAALIGCCVTTGVGSVINQPGIEAGARMAVFGCGGVGLNVIQGARLLNASQVIAVDIIEHKLRFAEQFGASDTVDATASDPIEAIRELSGGGVDFAFDAFGSAETLSQAVDSLGKNGTAVMVGLAPVGDRTAIDMVDLVRNQKRIVGSYYGSGSPHQTFAKMVDFYTRGKIDVEALITRRHPLEEINEAFERLAAGEDGRGVIVFS
ncbi:MAG: Zn-dependent alcohol dehydrogenase [Dehalococcoidia bacterium]|jgi:Zn-dependent alcohol dehydrogenase|nr:Zn-dependent alcohol dehydrogenase [Dehalococcoidia bacterium]